MSSARDLQAAKERREWIQQYERERRYAEDTTEYQKYVQQMREENLEPLSFEQWKDFLPENDNPVLRGRLATSRANWTQLVQVTKERVASQPLSDDELSELGFDLRFRPNWEFEYLPAGIAAAFENFQKQEPRFVPSLHFRPVGDFLNRNRLILSRPHIEIAFNVYWNFCLITPKSELIEEANPGPLNEHGVNLRIERDPAIEESKRREQYGTAIVAVGPDGREYTEYQLDRLSADEYKLVMQLVGDRLPRFSNVLRPQ